MLVDVVLHPRELTPAHQEGRAVVVFDVLRATTTMTAALAAGVDAIHVFDTFAAAELAANARAAEGRRRPLLLGEVHALPAPGADVGNSPQQFNTAEHGGAILFMATTNGTRALVAARAARLLLTAALVNAAAAARALASAGRDITLLCSGTDGAVSMEDLLGAGAVLTALRSIAPVTPNNDTARIAARLFAGCAGQLHETLRDAQGGRNNLAVGQDADVAFCARLDAFDVVGVARGDPLVVRQLV